MYGYTWPQCMFCHKKIPIILIRDSTGLILIEDEEDVQQKQEQHFNESPGCAVLHQILHGEE